jgi:16S rRNA (cytosine1402-N4)-methyltransferase
MRRLVASEQATIAGMRRRPRYPGKNPRTFQQKYKELDPERYPAEAQKVLAAGKTPAGTHVPIMVDEVLHAAAPAPGDIAADCTLGGGGHAIALLERVRPGGRVIGLDVDPIELPRTEARLRAAGFGPDVFTAQLANFAGLPQALAAVGLVSANVVIADLGVSSMQLDNPERGFSYKGVGPLDMRMNPARGEPASGLIARSTEEDLATLLADGGDEPHADLIAALLVRHRPTTAQAAERAIRQGLTAALPRLAKPDVKMSLRRTFQALRIAVNGEFEMLEALLRALPACLSPGGRAVFITFHSGEDRRVKKSFQAGYRAGVYADVAPDVIRPSMAETRANRRASSAKLRWAVRSSAR